MFLVKILAVFLIITLKELIFCDGAWAWGPAVHTVISCNILESCSQILPAIASVIRSFPNEYIYGAISADFFLWKGQKRKKGHSHNWETGFKFLKGVGSDKEAAYAYGFLSHLAADVIAHNYFVPDLIYRRLRSKRIGHFYTEAVADRFVNPLYLKIAREILSMDHNDYDKVLRSSAVRNRYGFRTRKHIFTQSVRISDYFYCLPVLYGKGKGQPPNMEDERLAFMIDLSFRLVKNLLSYPDSSACLSYDPIGSDNLRLANQGCILSKLFKKRQSSFQFPVAQQLLEL
jgi:hypothetical protein